MSPRKSRNLAMLLLIACLLLAVAGQAFAGVDAYLVKEADETGYKFILGDLLDSYNTNGAIWADFNVRMQRAGVWAVYDMKRNRYLGFNALLNAYNAGVDIMVYSEKPDAVTVALPAKVLRATLQDGNVVYMALDTSALAQALLEINNSVQVAEMNDVLVRNAETLGLSLSIFNNLNAYGKNLAATEVITKQPVGGYVVASAVTQAFDEGVTKATATLAAAVKAVNDASNVAAISSALSQHATPLELQISRFTNLHTFAKDRIAERLLAKRPFASASAVNTAYLADVTWAEQSIVINRFNYNSTLSGALDAQMPLWPRPQTDLYWTGTGSYWQDADRVDVLWHLNPESFDEGDKDAIEINVTELNVRRFANTLSTKLTAVKLGERHIILGTEVVDGVIWYKIMANSKSGWVHGDYVTLVEKKATGFFQFLLLSGTAGVPEEELNNLLKGKGSLEGHGAAFIEGSKQHNINEIFLISLALHETGEGKSVLSTGVVYNEQIVYNMFGIGAKDEDPINLGAKYAFEQGWFTPELAIIGGAKFASANYINHATYKQDTLYKMRWNPAKPGLHQYATDIGWAFKQVKRVQSLYDQCNTYVLRFDFPIYKK